MWEVSWKLQSSATPNWSLNRGGNGEGRENEWMHETLLGSLRSGWGRSSNQTGSFYGKGEIAEKDIKESERLKRMLVTQFQKSADGLELTINQEDKTLFIRGLGEWKNTLKQSSMRRVQELHSASSYRRRNWVDWEECFVRVQRTEGVSISSLATINRIHLQTVPNWKEQKSQKIIQNLPQWMESYSTKKRPSSSHVHKQWVGKIGDGAFSGWQA